MRNTGIPIKGVKVKDGKLVRVHGYRDASHAIRAKTSKKTTVVSKQKSMMLPPGKPSKT